MPRRLRLLSWALLQAGALRVSFRHPRLFWILMTPALVGSGMATAEGGHPRAARVGAGWIASGAGAGLGAYLVTIAAALLLGRHPSGRRWLQQVHSCTGSCPRPLRAILVVPASIGEELFWREGVLVGDDRKRLRVGSEVAGYLAVQIASGNPTTVAGGLLLGLVTSLLRSRSGSLAPALTAHLMFSELTLVWPGLPPKAGFE